MAIWLTRAGSHGEYEQKFIQDSRIYLTWDCLCVDLFKLHERRELISKLKDLYPDRKGKTIQNWSSQIWPFVCDMKKGDIVILPLKSQPAIQIGELIDNAYHFEPNGPDPYFHWRSVKWIGEAIPRFHFGQDLLYSFGAFMTICEIHRNNAESRLKAMRQNNWKPESLANTVKGNLAETGVVGDHLGSDSNLDELAQDQIASLINARFKGHNLTRLVDAILRAQGYITYISPEGADGGADILAGAGPLGFGEPRLCVEVKSENSPIDRPAVDKLLGAVSKFGAQEGLFVSWSGFKSNVQKELAASFFRVRLWTQKELLEELFAHYEQLDEDIKAELPLKRIWTISVPEGENE